MLERFLRSISPSNIRELVFELIWDKYVNDDIASVIDIPDWKPIDDVLCDLAVRVRATDSERILNVVLSVVPSQSTEPGNVKLGSLFSKFRERGSVRLRRFADYLPPVSISSALAGPKLITHSVLGQILHRYASTGSGRSLATMKSDLII